LLLLWGSFAVIQDDLLYFPDNPPRPALLAQAANDGLQAWSDGADYRALLREPAGPARATLLLFHGNAGHAGHRADYARMLAGLGLRVLLAEYPGYGSRPGAPGEAALVADAAATLAAARRQFPGRLLVAGESLGAAVAAAIAGEADGLLLITPWDRLDNVGRHHYPWLPVRQLLRDRYDSAARLAGYRGRSAVVLAANDRIVPARFGHALYAGLGGPKRLWTVAGADHNDWLGRVDAAWWRELVDYLLDGGR
ncbi:MAG TPA: alpha/beta hydrolase, partial [Azonexus sp.]